MSDFLEPKNKQMIFNDPNIFKKLKDGDEVLIYLHHHNNNAELKLNWLRRDIIKILKRYFMPIGEYFGSDFVPFKYHKGDLEPPPAQNNLLLERNIHTFTDVQKDGNKNFIRVVEEEDGTYALIDASSDKQGAYLENFYPSYNENDKITLTIINKDRDNIIDVSQFPELKEKLSPNNPLTLRKLAAINKNLSKEEVKEALKFYLPPDMEEDLRKKQLTGGKRRTRRRRSNKKRTNKRKKTKTRMKKRKTHKRKTNKRRRKR
jgi:hypothetical protein